jgi:hypothetical protein
LNIEFGSFASEFELGIHCYIFSNIYSGGRAAAGEENAAKVEENDAEHEVNAAEHEVNVKESEENA